MFDKILTFVVYPLLPYFLAHIAIDLHKHKKTRLFWLYLLIMPCIAIPLIWQAKYFYAYIIIFYATLIFNLGDKPNNIN